MQSSDQLIESGILERYVIGLADAEEVNMVQAMKQAHAVAKELQEIEIALEKHALANAITPNTSVRAMLLATVDFTERLSNGEEPWESPILHPEISLADLAEILHDRIFEDPEDLDCITAKIISYTPEKLQAIVWASELEITETHSDQQESFMVVEGSCEVIFNGDAYTLFPGDYLSIPLHAPHTVRINKGGYCKVILQRLAA